MTWIGFALFFFASVWALIAVASLAVLIFDREHQPETSGLTTPLPEHDPSHLLECGMIRSGNTGLISAKRTETHRLEPVGK